MAGSSKTKTLISHSCVDLVHSLFTIFPVYRKQNHVMFDKMSQKKDGIAVHPSASIHIWRDISIYHGECLIPSNKTDEDGRSYNDLRTVRDLA